MRNTPALSSFTSPLWPRVAAPDRISIYSLNRTEQRTHAKLNYFKYNCFDV